MRMYVPLFLLLMSLICNAAEETFFIYKGKIFKMTNEHVTTINSLTFNKRESIMEYAVLEGFLVIRVSERVYKLFDMPVFKSDRIHLLLEEEAKTDSELKQI
jgi:hypothetical protein